MTRAPSLRPMRESDLDAVLAVQDQCYPPPMRESGEVVLARLRSAPDTTLVACDGDGVCAYLFAYPSLRGSITPLGAPFAPPPAPDTLYLHDLSVAPRALGRGLGRELVARMLALGVRAGLAHSALVSVQDSLRFWQGLGYVAASGAREGLASYPPGAVYMVRTLGQ